LCFVSVFWVSFKFVGHGGRRGNIAQALARWWHPVASSKALDVLYWEMRPTLYRCITMAIEIASDSPAVFVAIDSLSPTTIAK
jgi:hypothetical protein